MGDVGPQPAVHPPAYPHELTEVAYLDDGTAVLFRAIRPDDDARLERLFYRLSPESLYRRFFTPMTRPNPGMIRRLVNVDYVDRLALVAEIDDEIVAVARYDRLAALGLPQLPVAAREAEAAVIVEDAWQHRGIATRLLWRLSAAARPRGVEAFTAEILAENRPMLGLLYELSPSVQVSPGGGEYAVRLSLSGLDDQR